MTPIFSVKIPHDGNWTPRLDEMVGQAMGRRTEVLLPERCTGRVLHAGAPPAAGPAGFALTPVTASPGQDVLLDGPEMTFVLRDQEFGVTLPFFIQYLIDLGDVYETDSDASAGLVTSISDTLDLVWAPFRAAAQGELSTFADMLGCFNLPLENPPQPFTNLFWSNPNGAAHKVHLYACQMIRTYVDDTFYSHNSEKCDGFTEFIRDLISGGVGTNKDGTQSCTLTINYRNIDSEYAGSSPSHGGCADEWDCAEGFDPNLSTNGLVVCEGRDWDDWEPGWVDVPRCYTGTGSTVYCEEPLPPCGGIQIGLNFNITAHPRNLAYYGYYCDRALFLARMCMDQVLYRFQAGEWVTAGPALAEDAETATRLGRYALLIIAYHAQIFVHELGHSYLGGGHCPHDCCFDVAGKAWLCRVRARLGLPRDTFDTRGDGDFDNPYSIDTKYCGSCSTDGGVSSHHWYFCETHVDGKVGETAVYEALGCTETIFGAGTCS